MGAIHCLPIEMPWSSSPVNVYLIESEPLTLVDTGPNLEPCLKTLEGLLREHGYRVEDLERIVVTHEHIDHFGMASVLVERSGAELCAIDALAPWLAEAQDRIARVTEFRDELMLRHGVPARDIERMHEVEDPKLGWDPTVEVTRPLSDGDELEFSDRVWTVHRRPGHSPFDTVFFDPVGGELFAGDHLISHISPNPLITPRDGVYMDARPRALTLYRESLGRTCDIDARVTLAGHGAPIEDHRELIERRLRSMDRRRERVAGAIAARGRSTAHDIALGMWGEQAEDEPLLTLSEVLGYADILEREGLVVEEESGGTIHLEPTSGLAASASGEAG